ncbi:MAG: serine/threonine protein kinase [Chloroflexi bacterium]|nr:serine/threonine protein kinase [Chloroflexota bacterium]
MVRDGRAGLVVEDELRQVCADLERRLCAGEASSAEAVFASRHELKSDADAALEVIYTEFVAREALGQRPTPEEFCARFPQWRDGLEQLFQIHGAVGVGSVVDPAGPSGTPFPDTVRLRNLIGPGRNGAPRPVGSRVGSQVGSRIGNYELLAEVGRGGMGVVYKARQEGLNRLVALKMILTGADSGPQERARFRAEAEAAARLQHPNIVHIHEVGEHDGRPFLSLEFVDGGNLEAALTGAPWPAADAARLIETLAKAMHHAHQQGIVHRDLKPANILLSSVVGSPLSVAKKPGQLTTDHGQLTPKITDFGLARRMSSASLGGAAAPELTAAGAILGTPAYMAPEQAAGDAQKVGPAADVYALGAMLYELLTGRPPFQGVSVLETLEQVRTREPLPPSRSRPDLPRDAETICLKCLRKEAGQRYGSAKDLADDLGRFLRGEPIRARPTPAWEKAWKWAKRRPAVAGLLAALVLMTIIGLAGVTILWRQTAAALHTAQTDRDDKEAALAANLIALAHRDWVANDVDAARRHLDECPEPFRGPEWRYLDRACHSCLFVLGNSQASDSVRSVAWSPTGRYLAANHDLRTVKVWDPATGRERFTLTGHAQRIAKLAFDPDGRVVSVSWPSALDARNRSVPRNVQVKCWELENGREVSGFSTPLTMSHGMLSADGRRLAVAGLGKLTLVDIPGGPTQTTISELPVSINNSLTLSADGRLLAWWSELKAVHVWDTAAQAAVGQVLPALNLRCLVFSRGGSQLAMGGHETVRENGVVKVWDFRNGREPVTLRGHANPITCADFSPDGRRLATGSNDKTVIVWDLDTGNQLFTLRGHSSSVWTVAFSPDGTRLASGGSDGLVRIWDVQALADVR